MDGSLPTRSYSPLSNFLPDLLNSSYTFKLIWKYRSNLLQTYWSNLFGRRICVTCMIHSYAMCWLSCVVLNAMCWLSCVVLFSMCWVCSVVLYAMCWLWCVVSFAMCWIWCVVLFAMCWVWCVIMCAMCWVWCDHLFASVVFKEYRCQLYKMTWPYEQMHIYILNQIKCRCRYKISN